MRKRALAMLVVAAMCAMLAVPATGFAKESGKGGTPLPKADGAPQAIWPDDEWEDDDTSATANPAVPKSMHTLSDGSDEDWMWFSADATGQPFMFETEYEPGTGYFDSEIHLWNSSGVEIDQNDDSGVWPVTYESTIYWTAPAPGKYYIQVISNNTGTDGSVYTLHYTKGLARRISGADRFEVANAVSRLQYGNTDNPEYGTDYGPTTVVVASAWQPADAAAAQAFAMQNDSPLILVDQWDVPESVYVELTRLMQSNYWASSDIDIAVVGGPATIDDGVLAMLGTLPPVEDVYRLSGANRYETAAMAASATINGPSGFDGTVYITNGTAWADALCVGPVAAYDNGVVLYTMANDVPDATMDLIDSAGASDVVVVGGSASVGAAAIAELGSAVGTSNVEVIAAADRYKISRAVGMYGVDENGMNGSSAVIASGEAYADALTGGVIGWWTGGPLLLTKGATLSPEIQSFFAAEGPAYPGIYVIGGPATISDAVLNSIKMLYKNFPALPGGWSNNT